MLSIYVGYSNARLTLFVDLSKKEKTNIYSIEGFPLKVRQFSMQEKECREENVCSGRCKAIVRRIVEQVRAETEQWSQMQEMLGQVKEEMEVLHASRDFWEDRALDSDYHIQSLQSVVSFHTRLP